MIIHVLGGEGIKIYERVYNGTKSGTKSWFDMNKCWQEQKKCRNQIGTSTIDLNLVSTRFFWFWKFGKSKGVPR